MVRWVVCTSSFSQLFAQALLFRLKGGRGGCGRSGLLWGGGGGRVVIMITPALHDDDHMKRRDTR